MAAFATKNLKVLFIHGLESGPNGRKVQMLNKTFDVFAADMKMAGFKLKKKNSFLRKALKQHLLLLIIMILVLIFAIITKGYYKYILFGIVVLYILLIIIFRQELKGYVVSSSFQSCLEIQKKAISEYKPDIIIASSWGGAIAFELLKQNIWNGATILLCPAYLKVKCICNVQKIDYEDDSAQFIKDILTINTEYESLKYENKKWLIYHSNDDTVVNIKDSQLIVKYNEDKFELNIVENNGHGMKEFVASKQLNEAVKQYMNIQSH